jgi:hypothetical protein
MAATPCVVVYGNSVFLAGIKAELERDATLQVITVEAGRPDVTDLIRACNPRAVLFDLAAEKPGFTVTLLREQPSVPLIGVDPSSDELLVLSSHSVQALSVSDLVNVVHKERRGEGETRGHGEW